MDIKIYPLGAGREVGRSCLIITIIEKTKICLGLDNKSYITSEEKSQNEKIFKDFINEQKNQVAT